MKITDFDLYKELLREKSGLHLSQDKSYLIESRLNPVARKWGYDSLRAMTMAIQGVPEPELIRDIIEAMANNETSFFRDVHPFETFKDVVLAYMKGARTSRKRLRIWCTAASSGQEPYSIAILLKEMAEEFPGWRFEILATDISQDALEQAREGKYTQFEAQRGLSTQRLIQHFKQEGDRWQLNKDIQNMVKYDYFNLMDPMRKLGTFDIIFCRNVLVGFDDATKIKVLKNIAEQLAKDGFLFLGDEESVSETSGALRPVPGQRGLYATEEGGHL